LDVKIYEGMFILDSNRFGRDAETVSAQIPAMIEKLGGEMLVSRLWEDRRLAFPIKGQRKGAYWLTYFRLDGSRLAELKHQCQIADDILRSLLLKVEPRIADALVAHALSAPIPAPAAEDAKEAAKEEKFDDESLPVVDAVEGLPIDDEDA